MEYNLQEIARQAMRDRGFRVDFSRDTLEEIKFLQTRSLPTVSARDLREYFWSSIDNDESRDLDQLEYLEQTHGILKLFVAIADVNCRVVRESAIDKDAETNTTSVYTGVEIFPMLPEALSTDLTSLNEHQSRNAVVVELHFSSDYALQDFEIYRAVVENKAQLTYESVCSFLEKDGDRPLSNISRKRLEQIQSDERIQSQLLLQDRLAQGLRKIRIAAGALDFQRAELRAEKNAQGQFNLQSRLPTRATQMIEEFMVSANQAVDLFLERKKLPSIQRVVYEPKNWPRMRELAGENGGKLPADPDARALQRFLNLQREKTPETYPDLSLAMIKLMGRGEYSLRVPGEASQLHFGLSTTHYTHSSAPNRRFTDLLTQRLIYCAVDDSPLPYPIENLRRLAEHCTKREDDANRVERQVQKSIAAVALQPRIGEIFKGFITGASEKGTFVRVESPQVEGKIIGNVRNLKVGDHLLVKLVSTEPRKGFLDFERQD